MKKLIIIFFIIWFSWISSYFFINFDHSYKKEVTIDGSNEYKLDDIKAYFLGFKLNVKTDIVETSYGYKYIYSARNFLGIKRKVEINVNIVDKDAPIITLKGDNPLTITTGTAYIEKGYSAFDKIDGELSNKVTVSSNININKVGTYEVVYQVKDKSNNMSTVKRTVIIRPKIFSYQTKFDDIDNTERAWWSNNKFDFKRPTGGANLLELKKYNAYFLGPSERIIYLTFDEGSNDTYLEEIINILNRNNVKATIFVCGHYLETNKELIKKWVNDGHSIGNHTYHHKRMSDYANSEGYSTFVEEILSMEELFFEITGERMDKIYREPKGEWSYRSLAIVQELGYKTFFWSADYLDWDNEKTKEYALEQMLKRYHDGAIYLLHPKQKGNLEAIEDFIQEMKMQGYTFGLVKDISY